MGELSEGDLNSGRAEEIAPPDRPPYNFAMEIYNNTCSQDRPDPPALDWVKILALSRLEAKNVVILAERSEGVQGSWLLQCGVQSPYYLVLVPVVRAAPRGALVEKKTGGSATQGDWQG